MLQNKNNKLICLDTKYSTTRCVTSDMNKLDVLLDKNDRSITEGGLRTNSYYKASLPDKPLITVVTIVYNGVEYIEDTIISVLSQSYDNLEYIIIDGGSLDGTIDVIKKYENAIDYWISEKDRGIYDAMNKGASLSSGKWLNFMNAGDRFYSEFVVEKIKEHFYDTKVIFGRAKIIDAENKVWDYPDKRISHSNILEWLETKYPNHQSMFFPKCYYKKNEYDLNYPISADSHYKNASINELGYVFYDDYISKFYTGGVSSKPNIKGIAAICHERFARKDFKYRYLDYLLCLIKGIVKVSLYKIFGEKSMSVINKMRNNF